MPIPPLTKANSPILFGVFSVNQIFPSSPALMLYGKLAAVGGVNSPTGLVPPGAMTPILLVGPLLSVNQMFWHSPPEPAL